MTFYRNRIFPVLSGVLWVVFLFLDITRKADSTPVKFAAICLCCATALLGAKTTDGRLVAAALCFTVAADWFLLVRNSSYIHGVGLFIAVQAFYAIRISRFADKNKRRFPPFGHFLVLLFYFSFPIAYSLGGICFGSLTGRALAYFCVLCGNTVYAFILGNEHPHIRWFAWGLALFVCCDVCVGAWNLNLLPGFTRVGMWLFYLPSQVLIVLSQEPKKEVSDETAV